MATANLLMGLTAWGVFTLVLGLCVVFLGVSIIIFFVSLSGKIVGAMEKKKRTADPEDDEVTMTMPSAGEVGRASEDEIPDEIKVAIVAAIAAYYDGEKAKPEFVVRKIKKI